MKNTQILNFVLKGLLVVCSTCSTLHFHLFEYLSKNNLQIYDT